MFQQSEWAAGSVLTWPRCFLLWEEHGRQAYTSPFLPVPLVSMSVWKLCLCQGPAAEPAFQDTCWFGIVLGLNCATQTLSISTEKAFVVGKKRERYLSPRFQCIALVPFPLCSPKCKCSELETLRCSLHSSSQCLQPGGQSVLMKLQGADQVSAPVPGLSSVSHRPGFSVHIVMIYSGLGTNVLRFPFKGAAGCYIFKPMELVSQSYKTSSQVLGRWCLDIL